MRLHRVKVRFDSLIRKAAAALTTQAQAKNMKVVLSIDGGFGFVECDVLKMIRALINIIGNAIKFTPAGGTVDIGLHRESGDSGALAVEITDTGIGIAPQHLVRVTEKYFRAGEHVGGTGLGLSIAKEIVELHGGRLAVESPPPRRTRGTRVSVRMPMAASPTLLIVHTDTAARDLLEQQLGACGYHVVACASRAEALDIARRHQPDAAVIDVLTSGISEADLIFRMKTDADLQRIPVVAIGGGDADTTARAILNGLAIPMLPCPWRAEDLQDRIETVMSEGLPPSGGANP
jgi:CheY-like chemotaxis protein/two-component sensor histidine kinase